MTKAIIFIKKRPLSALTQGQCALCMVTGVYVSIIASALEHNRGRHFIIEIPKFSLPLMIHAVSNHIFGAQE